MQNEFVSSVNYIVDEANQKKIRLRAIGGIGFMMHCPHQTELLRAMHRQPSDIDLVGLGRQEDQIDRLFQSLGYTEKGGQGVTMEVWSDRRIFTHPVLPHVDVFFDGLDFCHKIDFRKRLDVASPTVSLADLLLGKLQIVEINEKDLQDVIVANLEHPLSGREEPEAINARYLAEVLAQDWGFYYTAVKNLQKAAKLARQYRFSMPQFPQLQKACEQIDELIAEIDDCPKSFRWKARAVIGTKVKWYRDPGEEYREVAEG